MSDRTLTPKQKDKIKKIREKWLEEADRNKMTLDGGSTTALAQIQLKYNKQIQEVLEASE